MISHWPPEPFVPHVAPPGPEQTGQSGPNGRGDILPVLELGARVVEALFFERVER